MAARRALVLGGTGMLAGVAAELLDDGWHVVLPSRRRPPGHQHATHWVRADWADPAGLVDGARAALGGPAQLLVAWVHHETRTSVLRAVEPLLTPAAPVVEVYGSTATNPLGGHPDPVLADHPTHQVVLGYVRHAGRTRWLTHDETSAGVLGAVRRAVAGRPPHVHQVGESRPVHAIG